MRKHEEEALKIRFSNAENAARVRLELLQDERDDLLDRATKAEGRLTKAESRVADLEQTIASLQAQVASLTPVTSTGSLSMNSLAMAATS